MSRIVLVVAAHADDEVLGCGGTIAWHAARGDCVHLLLLADGVSSRNASTAEELARRTSAAQAAASILGIQTLQQCGFADNQLDQISMLKIAQAVEGAVRTRRPDVVFTHHHGDLNVDHRRAHEAVLIACRPQPGCSVREIYGFEVLSSTEWATPRQDCFSPAVYVDISRYLTRKIEALQAYTEEMRPEPHSRSIRHAEILATHRGMCVGLEAAEAFEVYRIIRG